MRWVSKSAVYAAALILMGRPGVLLAAAPPPTFGKVTIPRVSSPPRLEAFLQMRPSPAWKGKMARSTDSSNAPPATATGLATHRSLPGYDARIFTGHSFASTKNRERFALDLARREEMFDDEMSK